MRAIGQVLIRAIAKTAAAGIAFVKSKPVRDKMIKDLFNGTLKAVGSALLVEGAISALDGKEAPDRTEESLGPALRDAGIDPDSPLKDGDLPKVLAVMRKLGYSDAAIRKFEEAALAEQSMGLPVELPREDSPGSSDGNVSGAHRTGVDTELAAYKEVAGLLGLAPNKVPELVRSMKILMTASPSVLQVIEDIGEMYASGGWRRTM